MLRKVITYITFPVLIAGLVLGLVGVVYAAGNIDATNKWAWGTNIGWINFDPSHSQVTINTSTSKFDGYAWGENVGWIHFQNALPEYCVKTSWSPTVVTLARFVARSAAGGNGLVLPLALVALGVVGLLLRARRRKRKP